MRPIVLSSAARPPGQNIFLIVTQMNGLHKMVKCKMRDLIFSAKFA
jgi:hypothetical protein